MKVKDHIGQASAIQHLHLGRGAFKVGTSLEDDLLKASPPQALNVREETGPEVGGGTGWKSRLPPRVRI